MKPESCSMNRFIWFISGHIYEELIIWLSLNSEMMQVGNEIWKSRNMQSVPVLYMNDSIIVC